MKRLLIANRGEIAIRIAHSASEYGLTTIGICAQDDTTSLHCAVVDEVTTLPAHGTKAYLDIPAIIAAALAAKADAIHPGYGFLSENAAFARAVETAGLTFIGPTPETLERFGTKTQALELAEQVGAATLSLRRDRLDFDAAKAAFDTLASGQSMMLKAISGGGGRGVRIVNEASELENAFARAGSEAAAAFGDDGLYAERYLHNARHIEVQIIGDGQGGVSHLWDRDCSLQRRHQKIIEIAPSPYLNPETRLSICDFAVKMAASEMYRGVGTFEFLVQADTQEIFFLEGNARLQVEHTVTETVLGLDLVKLQFAIADGQTLEALGLEQTRIPGPNGYAIQARIYAEKIDADGSIQPGVGTLERFLPPAQPGIRVDSCGYAGLTVSPAFDPLIAKVIAHVPSGRFEQSLARLQRSLDTFDIAGIPTNIAFLTALLKDERLRQYQVHTGFVDHNLAALAEAAAASQKTDPLAVLSTAAKHNRTTAPQASMVQAITDIPEGHASVPSRITGTLVSLDSAVGDDVWPGKIIAVIESMKMEHEVRADIAGILTSLQVEPGQTVLEGQDLAIVRLQDVDADDAREAENIDLDYIRPDLREALDRISASHDENRPEAVAKRHGRGHRTARENIADLCDEGSFIEYGSVVLAAQRSRRSMDDLIRNTTGDGMVCGLGHVNGDKFPDDRSRIMAMSYDYMVLAGTQGALNHYKKDRMFEIAEQQKLPTILFAEGGGGRPGDTDVTGVAGLDCLAFNYFARLSGLVPTIGIVNGRCFAGNAVLLGCCDVIIATEDSNIGVGGPAMIEGGGLGVFSPDEVGPIDVQVPNGVVDIAVKNEQDAVAAAKMYLSYFQGPVSDWTAPDPRALRFMVPENRLRLYDMREVIAGIADLDSCLELRAGWAPGIITMLARIEGRPVGIIANNPEHLSGAIDTPGADKAARFMQLCDAYDLPILSLIDCPGIMVGPEIEKTALIRHASRLMVIGANITTPLLSVVIRKGYGLGAQAMAGGSFRSPVLMVTWPTGEFGGMGLEGAVKLGFRKELEAIDDLAERQKLYEQKVAKSYERGKAINMASHFELDDVIDPAETRNRLLQTLRALPVPPARHHKKRPNIDTW
ncbi:MAG: carboxyl transferase domain-containing protein [Henriciella sp.]